MFQNLIFVMLGGAVGAALRYLVGLCCAQWSTNAFPFSTLIVNVLGCFLLGILCSLGERYIGFGNTSAYLMLSVGLCGAFTTFSPFSAETLRLLDSGHFFLALLYLLVSILAGFLLFYLGRKI